ncbi:hypothetical protein PIB30_040113 [Stylosanthes scabra]|uniref:NAC domain-containing protein n=1 Tax=Stylosanthes scabra TaxID=79078 RepID=A0ABU6REL2_9FABA|nr:hypothetical protein [Stylosanthes scabra]
MEEPVVVNKGEEPLDLPPGFRFHPTDEEIITCYLTEKVMNSSFSATAIGEADLNKSEPWDLPKKAKMGEKEWYFFCQKDRKYPTGMRTNRATDSGYWKATGKDKEIFKGKGNLVGMKKTLVFYRGRAPKGEKTNWVMHEFRLEGKFANYNLPKAAKDEWVVSRVFHKNTDVKKTTTTTTPSSSSTIIPGLLRMNSIGDDLLDCSTLPPLMDPHPHPSSGDEFKGVINNPLKSDGYYFPTFSSSLNNSHQILIKPEEQQHNNRSNQIAVTNYQIPNFNNTLSSHHHHNLFSSSSLDNNNNNNYQSSWPSYYGVDNINNLSHHQSSHNHHQQHDDMLLRAIASKNYNNGGECKVEQFSSGNQSVVSVSQETGLSNDRNTNDTSSVVSKQQHNNNNSKTLYEDLEGPSSSVAPLSDLECLWDAY